MCPMPLLVLYIRPRRAAGNFHVRSPPLLVVDHLNVIFIAAKHYNIQQLAHSCPVLSNHFLGWGGTVPSRSMIRRKKPRYVLSMYVASCVCQCYKCERLLYSPSCWFLVPSYLNFFKQALHSSNHVGTQDN